MKEGRSSGDVKRDGGMGDTRGVGKRRRKREVHDGLEQPYAVIPILSYKLGSE